MTNQSTEQHAPAGIDDTGEVIELRPERADNNTRLDRFVADHLTDMSRSYLSSLIEQGLILVDGHTVRPAFKVTVGEVVTVSLPPVEDVALQPEAIPLDIVYEDDDLLVINKPAGLVVHPAVGHPNGTLVNAVLHHAPDIAIAGSTRPGIVHRLDKDTSGLIVVAKTDRAQTSLVDQWQRRSVTKTYLVLASGVIDEEEGTIDAPIGRDRVHRQQMSVTRNGRDAVSHFDVVQRFTDATLLRVRIDTGRTHQIRVHLAFIGHHVVGDLVYGAKRSGAVAERVGLDRQFLHAERLGFELTDGTFREFTSELPTELADALSKLTAQERVHE